VSYVQDRLAEIRATTRKISKTKPLRTKAAGGTIRLKSQKPGRTDPDILERELVPSMERFEALADQLRQEDAELTAE
jgi:hypothetical protein